MRSGASKIVEEAVRNRPTRMRALVPEGPGSARRKPFYGTVSRDSLPSRLLQDNRNLGVAFQDSTQKLVAENDVEK
jgi:hypothetical protein